MSSNFLQWNPNQINQENDAAYASDPQRENGATNGSIFNSQTANKVFYQTSTFVTAMAQMLANKGYSTSDTSLSALTSILANIRTNADVLPPLASVPYSPTPVFDLSKSLGQSILLNGNVTSSTIINLPQAGSIVYFYIVSSSPGNYSFAWPSQCQWAPDVKTQSLGNLLTWQFISDGTALWPLSTFLINLEQMIGNINGEIGTINSDISGINTQINTINTNIANIPAMNSGWTIFPSGLIYQWKTDPTHDIDAAEHHRNVSFPTSFPNACFSVQVSTILNSISGGTGQMMSYQIDNSSGTTWNNNGVNIYRARSGSNSNMDTQAVIFAIGN